MQTYLALLAQKTSASSRDVQTLLFFALSPLSFPALPLSICFVSDGASFGRTVDRTTKSIARTNSSSVRSRVGETRPPLLESCMGTVIGNAAFGYRRVLGRLLWSRRMAMVAETTFARKVLPDSGSTWTYSKYGLASARSRRRVVASEDGS